MQALKRSVDLAVQGVRGCVQSRNYRHMPVQKNPYVEAWYNGREDLEYKNVISQGMLVSGFVWGLLIPFVVYEGIVGEFRTTEEALGARRHAFYPDDMGLKSDNASS